MNSLPPAFITLGLVLIGVGVVVAIAVVRVIRARGRMSRRRVLEQPNSHFNSQLVRNSETRHHWRNMALDRLHEINRGEVVRLLAKVEATSVDALRPDERAFLDRMAELAGATSPVEPRAKDSPVAPDLRPRPA